MSLDGVIVIDKPEGPTSARVVSAVRKRLSVRKIGHTGTLDPMATGVLPMCIGRATKIAGLLLSDDKAYTGTIVFGVETDTLDREGTVVREDRDAALSIDAGAVRAAFSALTGDIEQVPPMFSALRSNGVRLHKLARAGKTVERPPRSVRVDSFELTSFEPGRAHFAVSCSKGTYVRSLVRDVGAALGCGAHLAALRRTRAGAFTIEGALTLDDLDRATAAANLVSMSVALSHMPSVEVGEELVDRVLSGLQLRWGQVSAQEAPEGRFCVLGPAGELLALVQLVNEKLVYDRVFPPTSG